MALAEVEPNFGSWIFGFIAMIALPASFPQISSSFKTSSFWAD